MKIQACLFGALWVVGLGSMDVAHAAISLDAEHSVVLGGASLPPGRGEASGGPGTVEATAQRAFDGFAHTTWQMRPTDGQSSWVEYRFENDVSWLLTEYTVANSYASGTRDPQDWELVGSRDGETWVTIDTKKRQFFGRGNSTKSFRVRPREAFNRYRLVVSLTGSSLLELSEIGLVVKAPVLPPLALTVEAERGGALLQWNPVDRASGYTVLRATERSGPYSVIKSGVDATRYVDAGPFTESDMSYYIVSSELSGARAAPSVPVAVATPLTAPGGLRAKLGNGVVVLEWTPSPRAVAYVVKRSLTREGPFTTIGSRITSHAYTDEGLSAGTAYHYVVSGVANGKEGVESSPVSALFPPLAPTGLAAEPAKDQVALKWNAVALATSYKVLRSLAADAPKEEIAMVKDATSFVDTGISWQKTYHYAIAAVNECGVSAESPSVSATPIRPPSFWRR